MRRREMPRSDKSSYSDKQEPQAEHIEEGCERRDVKVGEAARLAWATVNKEEGKSGSGSHNRAQGKP
jgi:hypothetical protein